MVTGLQGLKQRHRAGQSRREQQCTGSPFEFRQHPFCDQIGGVLIAPVGNAGGAQLIVLIPGIGGRHLHPRHDAPIDGVEIVHCLGKQGVGTEIFIVAHRYSWLEIAAALATTDP